MPLPNGHVSPFAVSACELREMGMSGHFTPTKGVNMPDITATLRNWCIHDGATGKFATGSIFEDNGGRWPDGTPIITSKIVSREGNIITTRHSVYKLAEGEEHQPATAKLYDI